MIHDTILYDTISYDIILYDLVGWLIDWVIVYDGDRCGYYADDIYQATRWLLHFHTHCCCCCCIWCWCMMWMVDSTYCRLMLSLHCTAFWVTKDFVVCLSRDFSPHASFVGLVVRYRPSPLIVPFVGFVVQVPGSDCCYCCDYTRQQCITRQQHTTLSFTCWLAVCGLRTQQRWSELTPVSHVDAVSCRQYWLVFCYAVQFLTYSQGFLQF